MIYFYNRHLFSGGAETLIYRLLVKLKERKIPACVVCEKCDDKIKTMLDNAKVEICYNCQFYKNVTKGDVIIVFSLKELLEFQIRLLNRGCKVILYILGLYTLSLQRLNNHKTLLKLIRPIMGKYIAREIIHSRIIFIDRISAENAEVFYKNIFNVPNESIFPLPIEVDESLDELKLDNLNRDVFSILSIARADFPFKGYLKGLIEECTVLNKEKALSLTIISYGEGMKEVMKWVESAKRDGFSRIKIVGETLYKDLDKYVIKSNLYVGMGTTVLDAAKRGIISIPVQAHTYELRGNYLFHENPYCIGENPNHNIDHAEKLIRKVINMSDEGYMRAKIESSNAVRKIYSIDAFMNKFMKII